MILAGLYDCVDVFGNTEHISPLHYSEPLVFTR
jgi:hypothetical protein